MFRTALVYLGVTVFCALLGAIYELFSHGVYSYFMIYSFAFPLLMGTAPYLILVYLPLGTPNVHARMLCHAGVATLTVGSIARGILDIYGTANTLWFFYPVAGGALFIAGICFAAATCKKNKKDS